jgi:hypothetical protein
MFLRNVDIYLQSTRRRRNPETSNDSKLTCIANSVLEPCRQHCDRNQLWAWIQVLIVTNMWQSWGCACTHPPSPRITRSVRSGAATQDPIHRQHETCNRLTRFAPSSFEVSKNCISFFEFQFLWISTGEDKLINELFMHACKHTHTEINVFQWSKNT